MWKNGMHSLDNVIVCAWYVARRHDQVNTCGRECIKNGGLKQSLREVLTIIGNLKSSLPWKPSGQITKLRGTRVCACNHQECHTFPSWKMHSGADINFKHAKKIKTQWPQSYLSETTKLRLTQRKNARDASHIFNKQSPLHEANAFGLHGANTALYITFWCPAYVRTLSLRVGSHSFIVRSQLPVKKRF